jgi:hypothetical protein
VCSADAGVLCTFDGEYFFPVALRGLEKFPKDPGLFNAQYMTRMARIALMPPKAMRCRPSETL